MKKKELFELETMGILICAIYSTLIFSKGIFDQILRQSSTFLRTIFEYRVLTGKLFSISVCVFLFLLYFYNREKVNSKALKVNTIVSGCVLLLVLISNFSNAINGLLLQSKGFDLSGGNAALMDIGYVLRANLPILAFMLLVILKYKKTLTTIFLALEVVNITSVISLQVYAFGNIQKYGSQFPNSTSLLIQNILFFMLSLLYIGLLSLYAIKVELKRNQAENN